MDVIAWAINGLAVIGWLLNIKVERRKAAMIVFTVATLLSIAYFAVTRQVPFLLRSLFYLCIDVVTLARIYTKERNDGRD